MGIQNIANNIINIKNKIISPYSHLNYCGNQGIYITMSKCANTSIKMAIKEKYGVDEIRVRENNVYRALRGKYVFTFVRNPYARVLSYYLDKIVNFDSKNYELPKEMEFMVKTNTTISFKDFVKVISLIDDDTIDYHLKSMSYLIGGVEAKEINVGKVEEFDKDWSEVVEVLGLGKLKCLNKNRTKYSLQKYYDKETQRLVYERYNKDFKTFEYSKELKIKANKLHKK